MMAAGSTALGAMARNDIAQRAPNPDRHPPECEPSPSSTAIAGVMHVLGVLRHSRAAHYNGADIRIRVNAIAAAALFALRGDSNLCK